VAIFIKNSPTAEYQFAGRTEAINNHKNPDFVTLINVNYYFER